MSSREFAEWMAYYEIEPFGEERADWRAGMIAATIANIFRDTKKRRKPYKPQDFMPKLEEKREQTWQEQLQIVRMLNAAFGGKEKKKAP